MIQDTTPGLLRHVRRHQGLRHPVVPPAVVRGGDRRHDARKGGISPVDHIICVLTAAALTSALCLVILPALAAAFERWPS